MKSFRPVPIALALTALLLAHQAAALSEDDKSMNGPNGAARFSDPDDKTPSAVNLTGGSPSAGGVDPTTVRYDYDPSSGSYIPHQNK